MNVKEQLDRFTSHKKEIASKKLFSFVRHDTSEVLDIWLNTLTYIVYDVFLLVATILMSGKEKRIRTKEN